MLENKGPIVYFGPQPGAKRFLHFLVIIIVLVLMVVFLTSAARLEQVVEKTTIEKKINEFNSVLMVLTMEHIVANKQHELINFHHANPFNLIARRYPTTNYFGEVNGQADLLKKGGWYFDLNSKDVIYHSTQGEISRFQLIYSLNNEGAEEGGQSNKNHFGLLVLKKKP